MSGAVPHDFESFRIFGRKETNLRIMGDGLIHIDQRIVYFHGDTVS